mmetsp:Transcript_13139/g.30527  ORF Transcript_13139/g.30527 Transcript_13139/m.30527 type:complete len:101 (-) Transcript_13139:1008-1310(-)
MRTEKTGIYKHPGQNTKTSHVPKNPHRTNPARTAPRALHKLCPPQRREGLVMYNNKRTLMRAVLLESSRWLGGHGALRTPRSQALGLVVVSGWAVRQPSS